MGLTMSGLLALGIATTIVVVPILIVWAIVRAAHVQAQLYEQAAEQQNLARDHELATWEAAGQLPSRMFCQYPDDHAYMLDASRLDEYGYVHDMEPYWDEEVGVLMVHWKR